LALPFDKSAVAGVFAEMFPFFEINALRLEDGVGVRPFSTAESAGSAVALDAPVGLPLAGVSTFFPGAAVRREATFSFCSSLAFSVILMSRLGRAGIAAAGSTFVAFCRGFDICGVSLGSRGFRPRLDTILGHQTRK
jgi:hypothetical protein